MSANRKNGEEQQEELYTEAEEIQLPPPVEVKVQAWLERVNAEDSIPKAYVYKCVGNSQTNKELIGRWENEIPDEHEIGMLAGSGNYLMAISLPYKDGKPRQTSFTFRIGTTYDEARKKQAYNGPSPVYEPSRQVQVVQQPAGPQIDPMAMMKDTMTMFAQMMQVLRPEPSPDVSKLMIGQYQAMSEILKGNLQQTDEFLMSTLKKVRQEVGAIGADYEGEEGEEGEGEPPNLIMQLLPELIKLLPALLASPATGRLIQSAMASPKVAGVVNTTLQQQIDAANAAKAKGAVRRTVLNKAAAVKKTAVRKKPSLASTEKPVTGKEQPAGGENE